jgi:hypothetical protein
MLYFGIGAVAIVLLITLSLTALIKLTLGASVIFYLIRCAQDA